MEAQIWVSIPWLLRLFPFQGDDISSVGHLRRAVWRDVISPLGAALEGQELTIFDCSLRSLLSPVPMEPRNTLHIRAVCTPHDNGLAGARDTDAVPPGWSEPGNLHVYLYVDLGSVVQIAEQLYRTLWGEDLNVILEEISNDGTTWKYVPKTHIDHLKMSELGYNETRGLLVRPEYDVTFDVLEEDHRTEKNCGGVVVTGQPGIGKTCFLYYLLFRRLSEGKPVALEQRDFFILFHEGGVYRYPLNADPKYLPAGTWALSDSNGEPAAAHPCSAFQTVSERKTAWLIQTTSPVEMRWKNWRKTCKAGMFVMNHVSIEDITALSKVFNLDVSNIQRLYRKWGPSARTCLDLLQFGAEAEHEHSVTGAARRFVQDPPKIVNFDEANVSHRLFSIQPKGQDRTGRRMQIAEIATDHIKDIISYAAADADAEVQIKFFQKISTYPSFRVPAGKMFEEFVLSWLYARPDAEPLR